MESKTVDLDQLTELVQNTRRIAEELTLNHQEELSENHKVNIIGTAMINQRDSIQELAKSTQHIQEEMLGQVSRSEQQTSHIEQLVEKSDDRFRYLQKTHEMQHEFIASFDRLHEKHQKLVEANNDNYEDYNRTLEVTIEAVNQLQLRIGRIDIMSQTETLVSETEKLYEHIQAYIEKRNHYQEQLQQSVETLNSEIHTFSQEIQAYKEDVDVIGNIVRSCNDRAITIDGKLDTFIEHYNIKVQSEISTLDDAFEQPNNTEKQSRGFFSKLFGGDSSE